MKFSRVSSSGFRPFSRLAIAAAVLLVIGPYHPCGASLAPSDYFGGEDNEAYLDWVATLSSDLTSTAFIPSAADPTLGAALHWRIVDNKDELELAVAVKASGWIGFGLSRNGGMTGADLFIVESKNLSAIGDYHTLDVRYPQLDECQNWVLTDAQVESGFFLVQVRRKLDTGDTQDLPIIADGETTVPVSRVISAWGDESTFSYHGNNRARGALRWFSTGEVEQDRFDELMSTDSARSFVLTAGNYSVKSVVTEYAYFCFDSDDLKSRGVPMDSTVTVIGFNPIIDNSKHVHHFILYAKAAELGTNNATCDLGGFFGETSYVWAPGEPPFALPSNVGILLGGNNSGAYHSYMLEIHYDNSDLIEGAMDNSGVELYYIEEPREHTAGFLILGDPYLALRGTEIERGLADWQFSCPSSCSSLTLTEPVTVLREYLHMHKTGYSTYNEQLRNGEVIRTGRVEFFDFDQSGDPAVQQKPFEVLPGDAFNFRCYYKNDNQNRTFGFGSSEEMCMAFLLYYPRQVNTIESYGEVPWLCGVGLAQSGFADCEVQVASKVLAANETLGRVFGTAVNECVATNGSVATNGTGGDPDVGDSKSIIAGWDVSLPILIALLTLAASFFI